jgi:hypothetical protein
MSTSTVRLPLAPALALRTCPHCQTDYQRGWPLEEDDCCFACWITVIADEGAAIARQHLEEEGLLPEEYIGC